jgi:hypothetical protein
MFTKIYGETRTEIDSITEGGAAPPEWEEHLVKRLSKCQGEKEEKEKKEKKAVLEKHKKFVEKRVGDFIIFMKNTSLVSSEAERGVYLERLESFRMEYPLRLDGFISGGENKEIKEAPNK